MQFSFSIWLRWGLVTILLECFAGSGTKLLMYLFIHSYMPFICTTPFPVSTLFHSPFPYSLATSDYRSYSWYNIVIRTILCIYIKISPECRRGTQ
uniref:Putative secreted peptide n=1 Tax=Anopheles braziliensis TaxID=58242 RepID=A0A2M3ZNF5_9DIPT